MFPKGTVLDIENAYELIAAGAAEPVEIETPEAAPEIETAVIKTRRQKR